jgi:hypothetical protein
MLYRVSTNRTTEWVDGVGNEIFGSADAHRCDLDRLDWMPVQRAADDVTVRLALRRGRSSRRGIIVDPIDFDLDVAAGKSVDARMAESLAEANATLDAALRAAPDPELVAHWRRLGGTLPDPL